MSKWPRWKTVEWKVKKVIYPVTESERKCVNEARAMELVRKRVAKRIAEHAYHYEDGLVINFKHE
jgi:hypothetical protein